MLPSTGYFKAINCPFYESGTCDRPYCHFKHSKRGKLFCYLSLFSSKKHVIFFVTKNESFSGKTLSTLFNVYHGNVCVYAYIND